MTDVAIYRDAYGPLLGTPLLAPVPRPMSASADDHAGACCPECVAPALADGHKDTPNPDNWEDASGEAAEKESLKAALKEAGIPFGGNSGLAKLRELAATIPAK